MTPQERELIVDLFDRLAALERGPRDADAERLIREGLMRAPNAVYSLAQTVLLQDEALRTANDHIADLEQQVAHAQAPTNASGGSFLGNRSASKWNTGEVLRGAGSVPSVGGRGDQPMGVPPGYDRNGGAYAASPQGGYGAPPQGGPQGGGYGAPPPEQGRSGGGFLGTAAAVAAGAIGGGLLLNGIRSALGGQSQAGGGDKGPFGGAFDHITKSSSAAESSGSASGGSGDLARDAGLGDIGNRDDSGGGFFGLGNFGTGRKEDVASLDSEEDSETDEEDFADDSFDDDDSDDT
ncbi:MAG: DUF2076 domain-containing protein [Rhizobiales bacterium]|nr:DUF2076 domain-containing protein [Hyphomicrobiales bacterium]